MEINKAYLGDCLELMNNIDDKSVDLILCDLPYQKIKAKWDIQIPLDELWKHYNRIIKDNGVILLFAMTPFDKILGCSNLGMLKYEWIWDKPQATGFLNSKKRPLVAHEQILVFYKNQPKYYPQKTTGHTPIHSYTKRPDIQNRTEVYGNMNKVISGGGEVDRYPRSILRFSSDKQKNKSNGTIHPTQKPLKLCEYFISTYTDVGDLVLDNCAGSFTTCLAAKNLNRNWIGIEKEERYYNIGLKRLT